MAMDVVWIVYCPTKYNLADMGTKALNGATHQFLLNNQSFPLDANPARECQGAGDYSVNRVGIAQTPGTGIYIVQNSMVNKDISIAFADSEFCSHVWIDSNSRNYESQWENSYANSYAVEPDDCVGTNDNAKEWNQWESVELGTGNEVSETGS